MLSAIANFPLNIFSKRRTPGEITEKPNGASERSEDGVSACFGDLPENVRSRTALRDGVLHISEDLRGNHDLMSLVAKLERHVELLELIYHKPSEFEEQYSRYASRSIQVDNDIQRMAVNLIARARQKGASDIHIVDNGAYTRIKFRVLGMMLDDTQVEAELGKRMIRTIYGSLGESGDSSTFSEFERHDGRIAKRKYLPEDVYAVRIHTEPIECHQAESGTGTLMALRLLYDSTQASGSLAERMTALGFTLAQCKTLDVLTRRSGLVLVSGPTGHGKSTVLKHCMESMIENTPEKSFQSVEDPPEFNMRGMHQIKVITKQDVGSSAKIRGEAYTNALAGSMRSDPDTLMVGEIRYEEAAKAAIDASLTGHAVWSTIHANNGFGIIARLVNMLESSRNPLDMICDPNVLAGLEYQRLIPKLCPHCKKPLRELSREQREQALPDDIFDRLTRTNIPYEQIVGEGSHEGIFVRNAEGCKVCHGGFPGLLGQSVAAEVIHVNSEILDKLRRGGLAKAHEHWCREVRAKNGKDSPVTYLEHALELVRQGIVDPYLAEIRLGVSLDSSPFFDDMDDARR